MTDTLDARYDVDQDTPASDSAGHQMIEPDPMRKSVTTIGEATSAMAGRLPQFVRHG